MADGAAVGDERRAILSWLVHVAAAHDAAADRWTAAGLCIDRVSGGFNNALYRVEAGGQAYACKLCVPDERRRVAREYGLLHLLRLAGVDVAAEPLLLDESCAVLPFPTVVYRWLPGTILGPALDQPHLEAFLDSYQRLHVLRREDQPLALPTAWLHWFDLRPYVDELDGFWRNYGDWLTARGAEGAALQERLAVLVDGCTRELLSARVDLRPENLPLRLCRVDHNLGNVIVGEDGRVRWVDWEYAGWGDPAMDLAELRWHAAWEGVSDSQHAWLRQHYRRPAGDPAFETRLALWDRFVVTRWPFLILRWLWSLDNGPDRLRLSQPEADPAELWGQLVRFVERAECFR